MYDDVIEIVKAWRKKFMLIGVKFDWYCLETKHFNCLNTLSEEETYITWDRYAEPNWIRRPPSFAIFEHPLLNKRVDSYQTFMGNLTKDGFQMIGARTAESVQRLINMSHVKTDSISAGRRFYPIYDWGDKDIWFYLLKNNIDIPETYMQMWQVGVSRRHLRISQFFAIDTARSLVRMAEFNSDLMMRIERRQPNAYLAALYFDSEMFGRNGRGRKQIEKNQEEFNKDRDYKAEFIKYLYDDSNFDTPHQQEVRKWYKNRMIALIKYDTDQNDWRKLLEGIKSGDTKLRTGRAVSRSMKGKYNQKALEERR